MSASASSIDTTGFDRFGLHEALVRGIRAAGFETPRPIQLETIPAGRDGRDVLGLAQTGTGKTAAFALPLLDRLLEVRRKGPRALVIAPTRELATQIATEIRTLSRFTRLKMISIYGGVSMRSQVNVLRHRPEIVVGCPGRVLDLLQQGVLRLGRVETLVLDEADHMFDMGFLPDIRRILEALPARRQNLLFSATMPREIRRLADDVLTEPHVVELADAAPAASIDHALYLVAERRKPALLEHLLSGDDCDSAIVFTRTKHRARRLAEQLNKAGHRAVGLQGGNMSQPQRDRAMQGFRSRRYDILVATDIAARGIDVSGVSHVINFDVPNTPEAYTHRIGRTGRAECEGVACTFVTGHVRHRQ
jgi:ATP-dependent RNA helicase RhlE